MRVSLETEDNDGFEVGARPAHRSEEGEESRDRETNRPRDYGEGKEE